MAFSLSEVPRTLDAPKEMFLKRGDKCFFIQLGMNWPAFSQNFLPCNCCEIKYTVVVKLMLFLKKKYLVVRLFTASIFPRCLVIPAVQCMQCKALTRKVYVPRCS